MMAVSSCVWVLLVLLCTNVLFVSVVDSSCGSSRCYNGELNETWSDMENDTEQTCECFPGWHGDSCQFCGGKLRLNSTNGIVEDGPCEYDKLSNCIWFIEPPSNDSTIHLLVRSLSLECGWDYLHVFSGDSVYSEKIAAFTGRILEDTSAVDDITDIDANLTANFTANFITEPTDYISLSFTGPALLLYFYSDLGVSDAGFHLEYWVDDCPANCSENGLCNADGSCDCYSGWTGELCDREACPANCSGNGECNLELSKCICNESYTGLDCSIQSSFIRWSDHTDNNNTDWGSGGHSNVYWNQSLWLFGGYVLPSPSSSVVDEQATSSAAALWRYQLDDQSWELIEPEPSFVWPPMRYDHSAVVYEDTMVVFGGLLIPSETFTDLLWTYDFSSGLWELIPTARGNNSFSITTVSMEFNNDTEFSGDNDTSDSNDTIPWGLPLPVRGHTAHVIGNKMVVFFGLAYAAELFPSAIQELDLDNMTWSIPLQKGTVPNGRHGHTSVYSEELGAVYIYGGTLLGRFRDYLYMFNVTTYTWYQLDSSDQPNLYYHSAILLHHLLVLHGGRNNECFSNLTIVYDTVCQRWFQLSGLGVGQLGHTAVAINEESAMLVFGGFDGQVLSNIIKIQFSDCSQLDNMSECILASYGKCGWDNSTESCVEVSTFTQPDLVMHCASAFCLRHQSYNDCAIHMYNDSCQWSNLDLCVPLERQIDDSIVNTTVTEVVLEGEVCSRLRGCEACLMAGCYFVDGERCVSNMSNDSLSMAQCLQHSSRCYDYSSCDTCPPERCLWCASLQHCAPSSFYPQIYPFGQCLGWHKSSVNGVSGCPGVGNCSYNSCSDCEANVGCGWCNAPEETGLGRCVRGGFTSPHDQCPAEDWSWFYSECPLCNCNGHSTCINGSVCENCTNHTTGEQCEYCEFGYTGNPINGGRCEECFCNGFGNACDNRSGVCHCDEYGVDGAHCTMCASDADGSVEDYCYYRLDVGYTYTISIDEVYRRRGSFLVFPPSSYDLYFELEMLRHNQSNPDRKSLDLYLYAGRRTQGLLQLDNTTNLTGPVTIRSKVDYTIKDGDFGDGDVGVLIYVDNMFPPIRFKITLKQNSYLFLLYFFAAFCTCFLTLLLGFLLIWYIKKKLAYRQFIRAHQREMRQRISRPFTKMNVIVNNKPTLEKQQASCVGVEPCSDGKAAVLSLLVQLPGDKGNKPRHGQSGVCVGSALVRSSRTEVKQTARQRNTT
ncbi:attractin-like protein 1 [Dysidea avara]|uniref:attractin-like protein 1 n=1 Tax=Dysidea avara TaxID=196820 RepID=UPI00332357FE